MSITDVVDRQDYNAMEYLACILASCYMDSEDMIEFEEMEAEVRWLLLSRLKVEESLKDVVRRLAKLVDDRYPFLDQKDDE